MYLFAVGYIFMSPQKHVETSEMPLYFNGSRLHVCHAYEQYHYSQKTEAMQEGM